jgi:hypothetical protein
VGPDVVGAVRRDPVSSSNLVSVGYDAATRVLEVEFRNGGIYQYTGVPADVWRDFVTASSLGGYLARQIKPRFPFRRLA